MKKITLLAFTGCLALLSFKSLGQSNFKLGYGLLGVSGQGSSQQYQGIDITYEHALKEPYSLGLFASYHWYSISGLFSSGTATVFTIQPEFKYYFGQRLEGFYIGAEVAYHIFGSEFNSSGVGTSTSSSGYFGLGALLGYQVNLGGDFGLNLTAGAGGIIVPNSYTKQTNFYSKYNLGVQLCNKF